MTAMEIRMPFGLIGSFAPSRAGGFVGNQRFHSSFMPAKSDSSSRMKVAWTTSSMVDGPTRRRSRSLSSPGYSPRIPRVPQRC